MQCQSCEATNTSRENGYTSRLRTHSAAKRIQSEKRQHSSVMITYVPSAPQETFAGQTGLRWFPMPHMPSGGRMRKALPSRTLTIPINFHQLQPTRRDQCLARSTTLTISINQPTNQSINQSIHAQLRIPYPPIIAGVVTPSLRDLPHSAMPFFVDRFTIGCPP